MDQADFDVPSEWMQIAEKLDSMVSAMRAPLEPEQNWTADSPAALLMAHADAFVDLPYKSPGNTALVHPLMSFNIMQDHLGGCAAVLRAPRILVSFSTLMRTYLTAAADVHYLADPTVDETERMRRVVNTDLKSLTESMNLSESDPGRVAHRESERADLLAGARKLGWKPHVAPRSARDTYWRDCWVGAKPPTDMVRLRRLLAEALPEQMADSIYRTLSASTHAQPFALTSLMDMEGIRPVEPGGFRTAVMMDGKTLLTWLVTMVFAANEVMQRLSVLYGWDLLRWRSVGLVAAAEWVTELRAASPLGATLVASGLTLSDESDPLRRVGRALPIETVALDDRELRRGSEGTTRAELRSR